MKTPTKITVITVCLNAATTIERTITSVTQQDYPHLEYIVIDGDSTDGTLAILKKHDHAINTLVSEKDSGIYHAMNKALALSHGDIIIFLNADDYFCDAHTITDVIQQFDDNPLTQIIYSKTILINDPVRILPYLPHNRVYHHTWEPYLWSSIHQRFYTRKIVFERFGNFNERYKIHADYDWFLRAWKNKINMLFLDRYTAYYNAQGISFRTSRSTILERTEIIFKNSSIPIFLLYLFYVLYKSLKLCIYTLKFYFIKSHAHRSN